MQSAATAVTALHQNSQPIQDGIMSKNQTQPLVFGPESNLCLDVLFGFVFCICESICHKYTYT